MEGLVGLIVLIISVIGWVANAINENKAKQARPQQGQGGRPRPQRRLQDEIETFLKEIQQQQGGQQKQQPGAQRQQEERARPLRDRQPQPVAKEPTRRPPKPTRKQRRQSTSKSEASRSRREPERRSRPTVDVPQVKSPISSAELSVSDKEVEHFLTREFEQGPRRELRDILNPEQLAALKQLARAKTVPTGQVSVAEMLKSDNIRNAFIINEILQRPRSLR